MRDYPPVVALQSPERGSDSSAGYLLILRSLQTLARCVSLLAATALPLQLAGTDSVALAHASPTREISRISARIEAAPEDFELRLSRSELLLRVGHPREALADLRVARALSPGDPRVILGRAEVLHALGRGSEALRELDALARDAQPPYAFAAYALRARLLADAGRRVQAISAYDAALRIRPDLDLYLAEGRLLVTMARLSSAAAIYRGGIVALGGAAVLREALARLEISRRRFSAALVEVNALMDQSRFDGAWFLLRAEVHAAAGRREAAHDDRERALLEALQLAARRSVPTARILVARALIDLGRPSEAIPVLEEVMARAPRNQDASALLALARGETGRRP